MFQVLEVVVGQNDSMIISSSIFYKKTKQKITTDLLLIAME